MGNFEVPQKIWNTLDEKEFKPIFTPSPAQNAGESLLFSRMRDSEAPGALDRFMKGEEPKTAVIFTDGLDF